MIYVPVLVRILYFMMYDQIQSIYEMLATYNY